MKLGIAELYCGKSGKKGFYNSQEIGLARAMKRRGHSCVIFYPDPTAKKRREEPVEQGILIVYVPALALGVHGRYDWSVLRDYDVQAVQVGSDNQIFAAELVAYCDRHRLPVYNYIGTLGTDSGNFLKRTVLGLAGRRTLAMLRCHKCFVKTDALRQRAAAMGIGDCTVAPVGLDLTEIPTFTETKAQLRQRLDLAESAAQLLFVGRLDPYKRPLELVSLMKLLPETAHLTVIGQGSLEQELDAALSAAGLAHRVTRIPRLPNREVQAYYKACDYYINLNQNEIFGMSLLEALYQGCTVLACHAPGPDAILADGASGYLVDDIEQMAAHILAGDAVPPEVAAARVTEHFTWDISAALFDEWLQRSLHG